MISRAHPLLLVAGLIVWAVWFVFTYSALSVACVVSPSLANSAFTWLNSVLLISTLSLTVLLLYLAYRVEHSIRRLAKNDNKRYFILWIGAGSFLAASIATLSIGIMVVFYPPCL